MKVYLVGGAVRDELLGVEPKDKDYVVVGSTVEEMISKGFSLIFGSKFPVFIHPETGEEYALARTEYKDGVGYKGFELSFSPETTIEEDLYRRDLTINAIAKDLETGEYIDPYGGIKDIENKILRNVSEHFGDDPLRALRAARFLSRYPDFYPHMTLQIECVLAAKEIHTLPKERVWMEMDKALKGKEPTNFFRWVGCSCPELFPELYNLAIVDMKNDYHQEANAFEHTMMVVDKAKKLFDDPVVTFAGLMHDLGKFVCYEEFGHLHGHEDAGIPVVSSFCDKFKVPNEYRNVAVITTKQHLKVHNILGRGKNKAARPKSIMKLFEESGAMSHKERFEKVLKACEADAKGRIGIAADDEYLQRPYLMECLEAVLSLDTKPISQKLLDEGKSGKIIGETIRAARIQAIRQVKIKWDCDRITIALEGIKVDIEGTTYSGLVEISSGIICVYHGDFSKTTKSTRDLSCDTKLARHMLRELIKEKSNEE